MSTPTGGSRLLRLFKDSKEEVVKGSILSGTMRSFLGAMGNLWGPLWRMVSPCFGESQHPKWVFKFLSQGSTHSLLYRPFFINMLDFLGIGFQNPKEDIKQSQNGLVISPKMTPKWPQNPKTSQNPFLPPKPPSPPTLPSNWLVSSFAPPTGSSYATTGRRNGTCRP